MASFPWLSGETVSLWRHHPALEEQQVVPGSQELQQGHESSVESKLDLIHKNLVFQSRCLSLPFFGKNFFFMHSVAFLDTYTAYLDYTNFPLDTPNPHVLPPLLKSIRVTH